MLDIDTILCIEIFAIQCNYRAKIQLDLLNNDLYSWGGLILIFFFLLFYVFEKALIYILQPSVCGSECKIHYVLRFPHSKALIPAADSCLAMDRNENE